MTAPKMPGTDDICVICGSREERENILVQTMEGRRQKAREGRWNGGFAPYGYQLVNGELIIAEDEAEIIRIIYDKFANTTMEWLR